MRSTAPRGPGDTPIPRPYSSHRKPQSGSTSHPAPISQSRQPVLPVADGGHDPRWAWVIAETLTGPEHPTIVLDGIRPRALTRLNNSSVASSGAAARLLDPLIQLCTSTGSAQDKLFPLPDGHTLRLIGLPIPGPTGYVHAVALWVGARTDTMPPPPAVGAIEWTPAGIAQGTAAAHFLLRMSYGDLPNIHTVPEMLAGFDPWHDRAGFLALFNLMSPTNQWIGTATKTYEDGAPRQLQIAARGEGIGTNRTVRAIVTDITGLDTPAVPDLCSIAVRHMPIPPGHALGLVDLKTGFIHEWLTDPRSPLAGWRHHNPQFDEHGRIDATTTVFALANGTLRETETNVRMRFDPDDPWISLRTRWRRISDGERPQAIIDVEPTSSVPRLAVSKCRICQDISAASTQGTE